MTMTLTPPKRKIFTMENWRDHPPRAFDCMGWEQYLKMSSAFDGTPVRVSLYKGRLEIMSISHEHENSKKLIANMINVMAIETETEVVSSGSTTLRREDLKAACEPDECYYIANERKIRGRKKIDLKRDPPPDLVVEIDISYHLVDREGIYAEMGVPELWRFDWKKVQAYRLVKGEWSAIEKSIAFPLLKPADLNKFIKQAGKVGEITMLRAFREWVRTLPSK